MTKFYEVLGEDYYSLERDIKGTTLIADKTEHRGEGPDSSTMYFRIVQCDQPPESCVDRWHAAAFGRSRNADPSWSEVSIDYVRKVVENEGWTKRPSYKLVEGLLSTAHKNTPE